MSSSVRCASAASTSSCMPLTISVTRSASARAACSRSSASRSASRRRRSDTSRRKPAANTSPRAVTRDTLASAGKRVPSRRCSSRSNTREVSSGPSSTAVRRSSCRSRNSGGMISARMVVPIASSDGQPSIRSAAAFQLRITPSRSSVTNASGALSSTSRVRASLCLSSASRSSARSAAARRRSSIREISRPAISGVPTASSQRIAGLIGSWIASTTA